MQQNLFRVFVRKKLCYVSSLLVFIEPYIQDTSLMPQSKDKWQHQNLFPANKTKWEHLTDHISHRSGTSYPRTMNIQYSALFNFSNSLKDPKLFSW